MTVRVFTVVGMLCGLMAVGIFQLWWTVARPLETIEVGADYYGPPHPGTIVAIHAPTVGYWLYPVLFAGPAVIGVLVGLGFARAGWTLSRPK
ncbi:hypothetical protein [Nocardia africana]|uniref:Uncharacterized protein n=1 Tax=Nocardia africana TaxID=134964 RepID=A0ABW6NMI9_9NOCA